MFTGVSCNLPAPGAGRFFFARTGEDPKNNRARLRGDEERKPEGSP
jgi:hypothetical protein